MGKNSQRKKTGSSAVLNTPISRAFSAGGIVWKADKGKNLFLIIRPVGTDRWQIPKGTIEKGETSKDAALREVKEETGMETEIVDKLGTSQYFFVLHGQRIFKTVTFFLMKHVNGDISKQDAEIDEAVLLPFEEAYSRLTFKDDKGILQKANEILASLA